MSTSRSTSQRSGRTTAPTTREARRRVAATGSDRHVVSPASERARPARDRSARPRLEPQRPRAERAAGPARPPADARLQQRRIEVARQNGRRRLKRIAIAVALIGALVGTLSLLHSSLFGARAVRVVGAEHTSVAQVLATTRLNQHPPLIDLSAATLAARVERLPWVARARVQLQWPDGVLVDITERAPIAAAMVGAHQVALLDAHGRVLALQGHARGLVPVQLSTTRVLPGENVAAADRAVLRLAGEVPRSLLARLALVREDKNLGLVLMLTSRTQVVFGSLTDAREKFVSLATLLADHATTHVNSVDLRVPAAPVLTP